MKKCCNCFHVGIEGDDTQFMWIQGENRRVCVRGDKCAQRIKEAHQMARGEFILTRRDPRLKKWAEIIG